MLNAVLTVTPVPVQNLFNSVGDVTSGIFDAVTNVTGEIVGNPILLVGISIGLIGMAIGLFRKFL